MSTHEPQSSASAWIGTAGLFGGCGFIALILAVRAGVPLGPIGRIVYRSPTASWGVALSAAVCGAALVWRSSVRNEDEGPPQASSPFRTARLYTRRGCGLCEEARQMLDAFAARLPDIETVDIDQSDELRERFTDCVPVLELDGKVRFRGRISPILLRRLLDATSHPDL
jgi:glutaredoxin